MLTKEQASELRGLIDAVRSKDQLVHDYGTWRDPNPDRMAGFVKEQREAWKALDDFVAAITLDFVRWRLDFMRWRRRVLS